MLLRAHFEQYHDKGFRAPLAVVLLKLKCLYTAVYVVKCLGMVKHTVQGSKSTSDSSSCEVPDIQSPQPHPPKPHIWHLPTAAAENRNTICQPHHHHAERDIQSPQPQTTPTHLAEWIPRNLTQLASLFLTVSSHRYPRQRGPHSKCHKHPTWQATIPTRF